MSEVKFFRKNGMLTHYSLRCGYVEMRWKEQGIEVYMEHCAFHVRRYIPDDSSKRVWETFDTMGEAYKCASALANA